MLNIFNVGDFGKISKDMIFFAPEVRQLKVGVIHLL